MRFYTPDEYLDKVHSQSLQAKNLYIDVQECFNSIKKDYGNENPYGSDKILFRKIQEFASNLEVRKDFVKQQNEQALFMVKRHAKRVVKILENKNMKINNSKIKLAPITFGDTDVFAKKFPNGETLIATNRAIFDFLYLMGRIITSLATKVSIEREGELITESFDLEEELIEYELKNNKRVHIEFINAITLYLTSNRINKSELYEEKDENISLSHILYDVAEFFIIAHEYAHIVLGHIDGKEVSKEVRFNREFDADKLALEIVLEHSIAKEYYSTFSLLGIEFLFQCFDILNKVNHKEENKTHPSPEERIYNLRTELKNTFPKYKEEIEDWAEVTGYIINTLWEKNKEAINNIYNMM